MCEFDLLTAPYPRLSLVYAHASMTGVFQALATLPIAGYFIPFQDLQRLPLNHSLPSSSKDS